MQSNKRKIPQLSYLFLVRRVVRYHLILVPFFLGLLSRYLSSLGECCIRVVIVFGFGIWMSRHDLSTYIINSRTFVLPLESYSRLKSELVHLKRLKSTVMHLFWLQIQNNPCFILRFTLTRDAHEQILASPVRTGEGSLFVVTP